MKSFAVVALIAVVISVAVALPDGYHAHHGHAHAAPAVEYTFPVKVPEVKCGHQLLINCNPHHAVVPCNKAAPAPAYHHAPSHHHAPAPGHYHH